MRRLIFCVLALACIEPVFGQGERFKPSFNEPFNLPREFLRTQWFLGFKFGGNLSPASSKTSVTGFSPINYDAEELEKDFSPEWGGHAGIDVTFYTKGFSFSVQPNYRRQAYSYQTSFEWQGDANTYSSDQNIEQRLDYVDLPLLIKYDLFGRSIRPFVGAGLYYSILTTAEKRVKIRSSDTSNDVPVDLGTQSFTLGNKASFKDNVTGWQVGAGFSWDPGNVRLILDVVYRDSFGGVSDDNAQFAENQLAGIGDVDDEISLRNVNVSLSFLFPLRFISDDFTSNF